MRYRELILMLWTLRLLVGKVIEDVLVRSGGISMVSLVESWGTKIQLILSFMLKILFLLTTLEMLSLD